jgi:hypothetical protein
VIAHACIVLHHIDLAPHALHHIALSSYVALLYARSRASGAAVGDSTGASPRGFGGSEAPICTDANIVMSKASPGASHPILDGLFELISLCQE